MNARGLCGMDFGQIYIFARKIDQPYEDFCAESSRTGQKIPSEEIYPVRLHFAEKLREKNCPELDSIS